MKCRAVTKQNFIDDIEMEEEGIFEILMDENALASMPRPGTSLRTPQHQTGRGGTATTSGSGGEYDQGVRPVTGGSVTDALESNRVGTAASARPATTMGRELRLGTASFTSTSTSLVNMEKLNVRKHCTRKGIAMVLVDYLLYVQHNTREALELCAEATMANDFKDWWWKAKLGKCYMKLGMLREAEMQLKSSIKQQPVINTYLDLCNLYIRMDVPNTAIDILTEASEKFTAEPRLLLGLARLYEQLNDADRAVSFYKQILILDASNVEAIACLGAHCFYTDQPEIAIRYYRRLLQMGVHTCELWNNLGLCCFYSGQYDLALSCFDQALSMAAEDEDAADIWYNICHIGVSLNDLGLAYQAFKVCLAVQPGHAEALNNIAVLEMKRQKLDLARSCLNSSKDIGKHLYEPLYNSALIHYRQGEFQESYADVQNALALYPQHADSKELQSILINTFTLT